MSHSSHINALCTLIYINDAFIFSKSVLLSNKANNDSNLKCMNLCTELYSTYLLILPIPVAPQSPKHNKNISSWMMVTKEEGHEYTLKDDLGGAVFVTESHPST